MSHSKLKTDIYQFIDKLNELRGFIQINSERNINFINYLKTNDRREKDLKIYLSESFCDLKGINEIDYNQYSNAELLKGKSIERKPCV